MTTAAVPAAGLSLSQRRSEIGPEKILRSRKASLSHTYHRLLLRLNSTSKWFKSFTTKIYFRREPEPRERTPRKTIPCYRWQLNLFNYWQVDCVMQTCEVNFLF